MAAVRHAGTQTTNDSLPAAVGLHSSRRDHSANGAGSQSYAREGNQAADTAPLELAKTVERCWQNVETDRANLVVETDATIEADESLTQQLLENLMRNAVEHGGPDVTLRVGDLDRGFYVEDDGPGVDPDRRTEVFEMGYSTTEEGTGLGLSIVKRIADSHDWDVRLTESEAGGTRIEVTGITILEE